MNSSRPDTVIVIAGGPSVAAIDLSLIPSDPVIIGVNDAALRAPRCTVAVSMDRLWTEARLRELIARGIPAFIRRSALQNLVLTEQDLEHVHAFDCEHRNNLMSQNLHQLNGTNSGACALNLAYIGSPDRVFLYGFDMRRGFRDVPYWYEPYPWRPKGGTSSGMYVAWAKQFDLVAAQFRDAGIEVWNVSPHSAITVWPRITSDEALRMLRA